MLLTAIWESTLQARIPRAQLSRVSSYDWLGSTALMPLGLILAAPLGAALGAGAALLLSAAVTVALTAVMLSVPGVRRLSRQPADQGRTDPARPSHGPASDHPVPTSAR
jgi:hypothetical protein